MDDFLRDIYFDVYRQWILNYKKDNFHVYQANHKQINIENQYSTGLITFNPFNIIELTVIRKQDEKVELYLHFQMKNLKLALDLFNELISTMEKIVSQPQIKILLCCSGGLTTSYFASKINDAAELMDFNYTAEAMSYTKLYNIGDEYDIVLLAPQISYMLPSTKKVLDSQIVLKIPPKVFGSYDVASIFTLIEEAIESRKNSNKSGIVLNNSDSDEEILSLGIVRNKESVTISYRVYSQKNILMANEIIKEFITMDDILSTIDTVIALYPHISKIGFTSPGVIQDNMIYSPIINGLEDINIKQLRNHYKQEFVFENDVNSAIIGYHSTMKENQSVSLIFYPQGCDCGVGTVINNQLIRGYKNFAGEVKYLPHNQDEANLQSNRNQEAVINHLSKCITSICSVIAPERIVICCRQATSTDVINNVVQQYIPSEYIPPLELISTNELKDYILIGQMLLCLNR